jgi:hypothetical protein
MRDSLPCGPPVTCVVVRFNYGTLSIDWAPGEGLLARMEARVRDARGAAVLSVDKVVGAGEEEGKAGQWLGEPFEMHEGVDLFFAAALAVVGAVLGVVYRLVRKGARARPPVPRPKKEL